MKCSKFCPFGLYAIWVALGYWAAQNSVRFLSGIDLATADYYPVVFPIMAGFFLSFFASGQDSGKRKWLPAFFGAMVFLAGAVVSLQWLWLYFDMIFLMPFVLFFALFALVSLWIFSPEDFLKKYLKLIGLVSVFYLGGLVIFLVAQFEWPFVVNVILKLLQTSFHYLSIPITAVPEIGMIGMKNFNVGIGLPCMGITSFLLFWSFYGLYGLVEWGRKKLNVPHFIIMFVLGLVSLFLLNSVRIGALVYIGANYSPEFAMNMFHNFAGVTLFLFFTIPYFLLTHRWIQQR